MRTAWSKVTADRPCPICGKPDWCGRTADGAVRCMRKAEAPPGWRVVRLRDENGGIVFRPSNGQVPSPVPSSSLPADSPVVSAKHFGKASHSYATREEATTVLEKQMGSKTSQCWDYRREGKTVGRVCRFDRPDGKTIRPISLIDGVWRLKAMPTPRTLYGGDVIGETKRIYVVEGEQCVDAARSIGLVAVTSAGGCKAARQTDWSPLTGKEAVLLPDNDKPGEAYAQSVMRILHTLHPHPIVKVVRLPDLAAKEDIADLLRKHREAGLSDESLRHEIKKLADKTGSMEDGPHIIGRCLAEVNPKKVSWLWPGRFPWGKLSLIAGDPGLGKSFLTLDIAARLSCGKPWPDQRDVPVAPGNTVILSAEDDADDTIVPRLQDAGADLSRVFVVDGVRTDAQGGERYFNLDGDLGMLDQHLKARDARLLIVDPVSAYLGGKRDSHKNADVRGLLAPLSIVAARRRCAVILVTHLNKGDSSKAIYRPMGSLAFAAAARMSWLVAKSREDEHQRLLLPLKANLIRDPQGIAFAVEDGRVRWFDGPVAEEADVLLRVSGVDRQKFRDAMDWLQEMLAKGPVPAKDVQQSATADGHSWRTIKRAKKSSRSLHEKKDLAKTRDGFGSLRRSHPMIAEGGQVRIGLLRLTGSKTPIFPEGGQTPRMAPFGWMRK